MDTKAQILGKYRGGSSQIGKMYQSFGGVARNIAITLSRLGLTVRIVSAIGDDYYSQQLEDDLRHAGVDTRGLVRRPGSSGRFVAVLDEQGNLVTGVNEFRAVDAFTTEEIAAREYLLKGTDWVVADCNLSTKVLHSVASLAQARGIPLAVEPTSVEKSFRLRAVLAQGIQIDFSSPNLQESCVLLGREEKHFDHIAHALHDMGIRRLSIGMESKGVFVSDIQSGQQESVSRSVHEVSDTTGGGDTAMAATLAGVIAGYDLATAARCGQLAAGIVVSSTENTPDSISWELLSKELTQ